MSVYARQELSEGGSSRRAWTDMLLPLMLLSIYYFLVMPLSYLLGFV